MVAFAVVCAFTLALFWTEGRRLLTRAFWTMLLVLLILSVVLPQLIDNGVIRPLDGGQVWALIFGPALIGSTAGVCIEAWTAPSADRDL